MSSTRDLALPLVLLAAASLACGHTVTQRTAYWLPSDSSAAARQCVEACEARFARGGRGARGRPGRGPARCLRGCPGIVESTDGVCADPTESVWCQEIIVSGFEVDDEVTVAVFRGAIDVAAATARSSRKDRDREEEEEEEEENDDDDPRRERRRATPSAASSNRRPATPRASE